MPFEKFENPEAIDNERRKAIAKSIRIISVEELKKFGEEMFDDPDRPWRKTFLQFVAEHPGASFYHASAGEGVIFVYSRDGRQRLVVSARERLRAIVGGRSAADEGSDRGRPSPISHGWDRLRFHSFRRTRGSSAVI
jgi:hypothetical protein